MKNTVILLLTLTTITLGVVCVTQSRKSAAQQAQMAALRDQEQAQSRQIEDLRAAQDRSKAQRRELVSRAEKLAAQLQARQAVKTTRPAVRAPVARPPSAETAKRAEEKGGFGGMLSKMMQDPDTRKFIQDQQRRTMDQMYAPLVKQMGLTPEEATQFKDLLAENAMRAADKASSMFGGLASTNRAATLKTLAAEQKASEEQVKAFLGEARYAQYKDYQETVGERTMLNQFKQQAGSDYNLSDPQTEALLTFMKEERKNVAATTGLPLGDADKDPSKFETLMSEDKVGQILQAQESVGQRVYERARTILSPEQLETLAKFQTNQMQMMRMGMSMAKKMFAPDSASAATTAQPGQ